MNKQEFLILLAHTTVSKNWDLPTPGRELDLSRKYFGPDSARRQEMKDSGRSLKKSENEEEILLGFGLEAKAHYNRSLEAEINQKRTHPKKFEEYFGHWIHSDPSYFPVETYKKLGEWFPSPKSLKIRKGGSYWRFRAQQVPPADAPKARAAEA